MNRSTTHTPWRTREVGSCSPLLLCFLASTAAAGVLHVPAEYDYISDAALVAVSGDTILVAPGIHALVGPELGPAVLRSGVVLLADGETPRDTEVFLASAFGEDGLILADDGPDTTIVEGFLLNSGNYETVVDVETPAAIIRGNFFFGGGPRRTILLRDGGVVEYNRFGMGARADVRILAGDAIVQYNTWNVQCNAGSFFAIEVDPLGGAGVTAEIRNNTVNGPGGEFVIVDAAPPPTVELVNNIFAYGSVVAGGSSTETAVLNFHHNLFWSMGWELDEDIEVTFGPGNIDWGEGPGDYLFCYGEDGHEACDVTIDGRSPVVGAGENGETLGALPIGCHDVSPVDEYGDSGSPLRPSALGWPRPNPASGTVRIPITLPGTLGSRIEVFDATGRLVRWLSVRAGTDELVWNGRDSAGLRVAPGVYFLREAVTGGIRSVRIVE